MIPSPLPGVGAMSPATNTAVGARAGPDVEGAALAGAFAGTFSDALDAASASADARAAATVDQPRERASHQEGDASSATGRRTSPAAPGGNANRAKAIPGRPQADAPAVNMADEAPVDAGLRPGERHVPSARDAKIRDDTDGLAPAAADDTTLLLAELQALHGTAMPAPHQTHLDMTASRPSKDKAAPAPEVRKSAAPAGSDPDMRLPVPSGSSASNASTPPAVAISANPQAPATAPTPAGSGEPAAASDRDNGLAVVTLPPPAQMPALPPFAAALGTAAAIHEGRLAAAPGSADFAGQLGTQLTTFVREGVQHARLQLHPAELGPVTVRIQLDGQAAQVHLTAEHALTRQALEQSMPTLAGSLREAGLTLSGGGVFDQPRQRGDNPSDPSASGPRQPRGNDRDAEALLRPLAAARSRRGVVDLVA